ncbi:MAG: LPS biosynthesis protein WbpP [Rhodobacteraceae bacterium]|nr:LPS biosynthesis protein WbpP [Paracoccaceae bacterium]
MKKCLVTGGCGFIGSHLARRLVSEGWAVDVVDNMSNGYLENLDGLKIRVLPNAYFLPDFDNAMSQKPGDHQVLVISDDFSHPQILKRVREKHYDVVFHQAAIPRVLYSVENPSATTDVNISGTIRLMEACRESVGRFIFASSSSVYGGADTLPTTEQTPRNPKSPYAWQKSAIEDAARIFSDLYNMDIVCLRYFNVYGPGQRGDSPYSTAVSAWCNAIKTGQKMRSDGDGTQTRDLCYIDNTVEANILAANASGKFKGEPYNIACGDRTSNREILDYFEEKFPDCEVRNAPWRAGDVMHTQADVSAAKERFGYDPKVRFWEGLDRTVEWWNL